MKTACVTYTLLLLLLAAVLFLWVADQNSIFGLIANPWLLAEISSILGMYKKTIKRRVLFKLSRQASQTASPRRRSLSPTSGCQFGAQTRMLSVSSIPSPLNVAKPQLVRNLIPQNKKKFKKIAHQWPCHIF